MTKLGPLVRITKATPLDDFIIRLEFEDGTRKDYDMKPHLWGPVFQPLRDDPDLFRSVFIEDGTVAWPNGADLDPYVLYYDLTPAWMEEKQRAE